MLNRSFGSQKMGRNNLLHWYNYIAFIKYSLLNSHLAQTDRIKTFESL